MFLMPKVRDLTDQRFGRLVAKECVGTDKWGNALWRCECDCEEGNEIVTSSPYLTEGETTSCGCVASENSRKKLAALNVEGTRPSAIASQTLNRRNTSGVKGVTWHKQKGKWKAFISFQGKYKHLGYFEFLDDAIAARKKAEKELYDPFLKKHINNAAREP